MTTTPSRILTSHVGSLPRSETLVNLLEQRENGVPYDVAAFDRAVAQFVAALVTRQVETGIDIVSDGEASKISYATYVRNRLTGFASQAESSKPHVDLKPFPEFQRRMTLLTGTRRFNGWPASDLSRHITGRRCRKISPICRPPSMLPNPSVPFSKLPRQA